MELYTEAGERFFFSVAFLAIVNSRLLGIEKLVPWPVLGAALLGTIGLNMLFPSRHRHGHYVYNRGIDGEVGGSGIS